MDDEQSRWLPPTAATSATRLSLTRLRILGNRCPLQRRLGGHERRLEDESHPQGAARSQQRFRNNHRQAHLQHGNNAVRRREADDLDADPVLPGGRRPLLGGPRYITHGEPSPNATFRFAEPVYIDKQQNFRVEIEVPDKDALNEIQRIYGPLNIWVVLDGYMTRDVQYRARSPYDTGSRQCLPRHPDHAPAPGAGHHTRATQKARRPAPAIPYDLGATFRITGRPGNVVQDVINISPNGVFVAVGMGYGFEDSERPVGPPGAIQFAATDGTMVVGDLVLEDSPSPPSSKGFRNPKVC